MSDLFSHTFHIQGREYLGWHRSLLDLQSLPDTVRYRAAAAAIKRHNWDTGKTRAVIPYPRIGKRGEGEEEY